jgi:uncharacterized protein (DUF2062 family)
MSAANNNSWRSLREWWMNPPRHGLQLLINPMEYRHLRLYGSMRIVGGCVATGASAICLGYGVYSWAAFFLAIGALNLAGGAWYFSVANSTPRPA